MNLVNNEIIGDFSTLVLASHSPRRKELLTEAKIPFQIVPAAIDEIFYENESPFEAARRLAMLKALTVAKKISSSKDIYVLGADTLVVINKQILGKPEGEASAFQFLKLLSGQTHHVITGYALVKVPDIMIMSEKEVSQVTFKPLTDEIMSAYVATGEPLDKAGAYAAQGQGATLIEKIEGSLSNVIGLPMEKLMPWFERVGILAKKNEKKRIF